MPLVQKEDYIASSIKAHFKKEGAKNSQFKKKMWHL